MSRISHSWTSKSGPRTVRGDLCRLTYRTEEGQEGSIVVGNEAVRIGRAPDCDLVLAHESVSRHHARVVRADEGWWIADLGSKNGLRINTYRTREQQLRNGDRIDLGTVKIFVEIGPMASTSRAQVVFQDEEQAANRAEVLDMDRLDSLIYSSPELTPEGSISMQPLASKSPQTPASVGESGGLLGVFSMAAEALLTCDSLDETLHRILELVFDNITAERGVICLYDEDSDTTEPKVMRTREGVAEEPIVISTNIASDCIKRRQSLLVQDANMDARFGGAESIIAMRIRSAMCAPLYRDGRVVGFIYVDQQSELDSFTASQLQTLSTLAILSAVAVEHSLLRDRVREEKEIRTRLTRYSSPAVVERIIGASVLAEQGMVAEEGEVTVLFADLTSFTTLAESLRPTEVVQVLNQIFERLTSEVFAVEGTLDKFRGDGMMAFFGAPLPMPDHAARAVECALRMQERIEELNAMGVAPGGIGMRVGVNSGPVVVGDIGSPQRKDYTVIGDVVNTASRLESSVARPGQVVVGEATYEQIRTRFECQQLPSTHLKGKQRPVRPYLVLSRL